MVKMTNLCVLVTVMSMAVPTVVSANEDQAQAERKMTFGNAWNWLTNHGWNYNINGGNGYNAGVNGGYNAGVNGGYNGGFNAGVNGGFNVGAYNNGNNGANNNNGYNNGANSNNPSTNNDQGGDGNPSSYRRLNEAEEKPQRRLTWGLINYLLSGWKQGYNGGY
ncbi:hypothetical protein AeMF1_015476, partial [Aphanomyces euteiches]